MRDGSSGAFERTRELIEIARALRKESRRLRQALKLERESMRRERARLRTYPQVVERLKMSQDEKRGK